MCQKESQYNSYKIYLQQAALQQLSLQQPSSEQLPFSQHFESATQQAEVHTQLEEPHGQAELLFAFKAYIVPAAINRIAVPKMMIFFFIFIDFKIRSCSNGQFFIWNKQSANCYCDKI